LRSGPRHCGHSASGAGLATAIVSNAKVQINANENKNLIESPYLLPPLMGNALAVARGVFVAGLDVFLETVISAAL
jgi:hypothetical protein